MTWPSTHPAGGDARVLVCSADRLAQDDAIDARYWAIISLSKLAIAKPGRPELSKSAAIRL